MLWRIRAPAVLIGALLLSGACGEVRVDDEETHAPTSGVAPEAATESELSAGSHLIREVTGDAVDAYRIHLEAGDYLHLVVDQQGFDAFCTLASPGGETLLEMDGLNSRWGPEEVFWLAKESGAHRLEVRPSGQGQAGRYEIRVRQLRDAREDDRRQAAAARLFDAGEKLRRRGESGAWPLAEQHYEDALVLWQELADPLRQAETVHRLAFISKQRSEHRRALELYERAGRLYEAVGQARAQAIMLHWAGWLYYRLGEIESAGQSYRQALQLRTALGDHREGSTANNLGLVNVILGEYQEALTLYNQALARWRQLGRRSQEARALHNLGRCYLYLGKFRQALDDLTLARAIRQELGDRDGQAMTLAAIGLVHEGMADEVGDRARQELTTALGFLQEALEISQETGKRQPVFLIILGRIHGKLGERAEALRSFGQALAVFRQQADSWREADTLYYMGALLAREEPEEARELLLAALPVFTEMGHRREVRALRSLALAERQRGDLVAARRYIEKALEKIEAFRVKPASYSLRSSFFALQQTAYDFYVDLLMELHRRDPAAGHAAEAFSASERARARSQLEALAENAADRRRGADPALLESQRELEEKINAKELQRLRLLEADFGGAATAMAAVERQLRDLLREYEQVRGRIRLASSSVDRARPRPLELREIQRRVVDGETLLLQYDLGDEHSYLWAVTPDSLASFELPARGEIERAARRAYDLLTISHRRESRLPTQTALTDLGEMLLGPVAGLLQRPPGGIEGGQRLLIASDGALQYIPFNALPLPGSAGATLLSEHEIVQTPSASMLGELRRQVAGRSPPPGLVAVVADPVFQSHDPRFRERREEPASGAAAPTRGAASDLARFERLVFSRREAEAILELVPAERSFRALDFMASRETVMSGILGQYRIVHFATHGYTDAAHPELSRLVLSLLDREGRPRDGFLLAHEIYGLSLPVDLVVLSACETALGEEIRGEGLVGLTQGFFSAGAASVLVSLWAVNDQATAELMADFYRRHLREGLRPAAALRQAQLAISRQKKRQAPYYWAGFVLQGAG